MIVFISGHLLFTLMSYKLSKTEVHELDLVPNLKNSLYVNNNMLQLNPSNLERGDFVLDRILSNINRMIKDLEH
jgi:hypothetical protein